MKILIAAAFLLPLTAWAADPPQAEISNRLVRAKLYLPDVENGYYRGPRFDWSGVIASLEYAGHNYFGQWSPRTEDRTAQTSISGPVEDFRTNGTALNYAEAKAGETFCEDRRGGIEEARGT